MVYRKCPHLTTDLTTLLTCCCAVPYARERWAHRTSGGGRGGEPECPMNESIFTSEKSKKSKKLQSYPLMDEIWLTSWYSKYPIIYRVLYIPGGAGFLPPNCSFFIHNSLFRDAGLPKKACHFPSWVPKDEQWPFSPFREFWQQQIQCWHFPKDLFLFSEVFFLILYPLATASVKIYRKTIGHDFGGSILSICLGTSTFSIWKLGDFRSIPDSEKSTMNEDVASYQKMGIFHCLVVSGVHSFPDKTGDLDSLEVNTRWFFLRHLDSMTHRFLVCIKKRSRSNPFFLSRKKNNNSDFVMEI